MSLFTEYEFSKCVKRYNGDRHSIKFNCRDQFLVMSFAQFTNRSGLRDIETTLDLCSQDLYRSGLKIMPKSTLAEANEKKDWRIYQDFGYILIQKAKSCTKEKNLGLTLMKWFALLTAAPLSCVWHCVHGQLSIMAREALRCTP